MIRLFVYGTLLKGEANHHIVAPYLIAVEPGVVRGTLYNVGPYPALMLSESHADGVIVGEWMTVSEAGLPALDQLENFYAPGDPRNEYERMRIVDIDGNREGWVYVYVRHDPSCFPEIATGSWRSVERQRGVFKCETISVQ
ncbi:gamma-glutamylcyclotransferase family protein [Paenibacillus hamazuiensis]|uniref:gamma-glutamylcyclotransferase family protein n=1 Tax=Paenibacillus hamazuiensis TaxID=2936508 RepID=UPI00200E44D1|nr:gamma-glutamylcyclotransferase family protein [Paenibacillus hamazuiensis]